MQEQSILEQRCQDENTRARELQGKAEHLTAQLELTNQKVERLNIEQNSSKSKLEQQLKSQI